MGEPRACGATSSVTAYGGDTFPKGEGWGADCHGAARLAMT